MIISIEGIDGAGKSTAAEFLADYITGAHARHCVVISEFNFCEEARQDKVKLKELMKAGKVNVQLQLALICQARERAWQHIVKVWEKHGHDAVVIFDRYLHSTIAYQGYVQGAGLPACLATTTVLPDQVLFLNVPVEVAEQRRMERLTEQACGAATAEASEEWRERLTNFNSGLLWAFRQTNMPVAFINGRQGIAGIQEDFARVADRLFSE